VCLPQFPSAVLDAAVAEVEQAQVWLLEARGGWRATVRQRADTLRAVRAALQLQVRVLFASENKTTNSNASTAAVKSRHFKNVTNWLI
jgi:hypothetical protein